LTVRAVVLLLIAQPVMAGETFVPTAAHVLMLGDGEPHASGGIHRARLDSPPTLYAAIEGRLGAKRVVVTQASAVVLHGKRVASSRLVPPDSIEGLSLRWFKVQPSGKSYDNTQGGFHWEPIRYREYPWGGWGRSFSRPADAHPLGDYPDTHAGAGTMAYKIQVRLGDHKADSPGSESIFRGGLSDAVPRVALRRGDDFLGRLSELFNTPYIWGSAGTKPADHQAERLIGSDCADFMVYGARRLGKNLRYRASWHIPEASREIARAEKVDAKNRYLDKAGKPITIGQDGVHIGDLLLFKGHVGALAEDRAPVGILDTNDVILHTYWAPPAEEPLSATAYSQSRLRVQRWR
jgi:hypothetical protein